jgi:sortase A
MWRIFDGGLLLVEILAVFALGYVLFNGFQAIRNLNQNRLSPKRFTLTPTPLIVALVLPSGHIPPDASGTPAPIRMKSPNTCDL